jgi:phospholipid-translocating ATPase
MKESADAPTTAAIGDGANDVSMIQEAHVGLGTLFIPSIMYCLEF